MSCGTPPTGKFRGLMGIDDRAIHAKGTVVNSLLLPHNRERHNGFLANSRDTSIEPETGADCLRSCHVSEYPAGRKGFFSSPSLFKKDLMKWRNCLIV